MNTQYTRLSMTPSGVLPVIYMSQYDVGRPIGFICDVDLDSYTVTLEATRTDGTAITAAVTTDGNIGAFETTATMTNKADHYGAQLVLSAFGKRVASLPFVMCVVKAEMDENAESIEEDASLYQQYTGTVQGLLAEIRAAIATNADNIAANTANIAANTAAISNINNRRFVIIGDSYTEGYSPDSDVTNSWAALFKQYMGLADEDCVIAYYGGAGFVGNSQGQTFNSILTNVSVTSPSTITDVIVAGGYNDKGHSEANIKSAIATFVTNAKSRFPKARIYIAEIGWERSGTGIYSLSTLADRYLHGAIEAGAAVISGAQYAMHNYFSYFESDGVHPNQQGQSSIAYQMVNFFRGSEPETMLAYTSMNISGSAFTHNVSANLASEMNGNIVVVSAKGLIQFTSTDGVNMGSADGNTLYDLGTLTAGYVWGNAYNTNAVPVNLQVTTGGTVYATTGHLVFKNGHMYIAVKLNSGGSAVSMSSVTSLTIYRFSATFNSLMC